MHVSCRKLQMIALQKASDAIIRDLLAFAALLPRDKSSDTYLQDYIVSLNLSMDFGLYELPAACPFVCASLYYTQLRFQQ